MTTVQALPRSVLYEHDETAWLETMAELIRLGRLDEIDYPNLAEYLADMARRDRREVESRLTVLIVHALKWAHSLRGAIGYYNARGYTDIVRAITRTVSIYSMLALIEGPSTHRSETVHMPLAPEVWSAARDSLLELFTLWLAQAPADFRRILRPSGPGTSSINIEPYKGTTTWIGFYRHLEKSASVPKVQAAIAQFQPELASYLVLPGRAHMLGDCKALISTWCRALESIASGGNDLPEAIDQLLSHVSDLLDQRRLNHRSITAITGLQLPPSVSPLELGGGAVLRHLTQEELVELGSHDITFGQHHDLMSHSVSSCVEINGSVPFTLEPVAPAALLTSTVDEEARRQVSMVLQALHVLKSGRAGIFLTTSEFTPALLPNLGGGSSWPLYRPPFASFEVSEPEVAEFIELHQSLRTNARDELRIATDRLVDAESRLSPVDALLDAVIGLEALLNPMDSAELAFRVALNYAFLAGAETRRERYERVRALQKTRNRVVHGGLKLQSPDATVIHEHAGLAKACLRDSIKSFLLDRTLAGNRKLDADFWLDRVLPTNIVAPGGLPQALGGQ